MGSGDGRPDGTDGIFARHLLFKIWVAGLVFAVLAQAVEWATVSTAAFSYDPWVLAGLFFAQVAFEPNRRIVLGMVAAVIVVSCVLVAADPGLLNFSIPYAMGAVSCATLLAMLPFASAPRRRQIAFIFMAGSLLVIGQQIAQAFQQFTTFEAWTFDSRAYLVDMSLGFNPLALILSIGNALPDILKAAYFPLIGFVYITVMMAMALVVLLQMKSVRWLVALAAMVLAGAIGGVLYHVFPAAGTGVTFEGIPRLPDPGTVEPALNLMGIEHVRNCMPSLHFAWALLVAMNAVGLPRALRVSAAAYAALTVLATMIDGNHYLIDLIVAVPFAVAVQALARSVVYRIRPELGFWVGAGLVAFWLYALVAHVGWFLAIHGFTAAMTLLTLGASGFACAMDMRKDEGRTVSVPAYGPEIFNLP